MRTFSKAALMATLTLGTLAGWKSLSAPHIDRTSIDVAIATLASSPLSNVHRDVEQHLRANMHAGVNRSLSTLLNSVQASFEPEPTLPPTSTGGAGTR